MCFVREVDIETRVHDTFFIWKVQGAPARKQESETRREAAHGGISVSTVWERLNPVGNLRIVEMCASELPHWWAKEVEVFIHSHTSHWLRAAPQNLNSLAVNLWAPEQSSLLEKLSGIENPVLVCGSPAFWRDRDWGILAGRWQQLL